MQNHFRIHGYVFILMCVRKMKLYIKVATSDKLSLHIKIFQDGSKKRIDYQNHVEIYYQ